MAEESNQVSSKIRWTIIGALVSLFMMVSVAGMTVLATNNPKDETIVPKVVGLTLSEAMIILQNSDLNTEITTRFVEDPQYEAGLVLQQTPVAGTYTKVGNMVKLTVSAGLAISHVENFIGLKIEEARTTIVSRYNGLLNIKEPLIYLVSQEPEGTIIGQDPIPGTPLSGPTPISFLISRGMVENSATLTSYEGLAIERALTLVAQNNLPFKFIIEGENVDGHPVVASQTPKAGASVGRDDVIQFIVRPTVSKDMILGVREINIPAHSSPIKVEMYAIIDNREVLLFSTYQQDVRLIAPYYQPVGTVIIIRANGQDQGRFTVQ
ncbi:PASTA domain-containing protein [Entomospira nematocerorum]|uniref:PASTA domain-containing protein n=1 Tax=Entomospira nematocerorum TaxID=2719987 RepID=A0A968GE04_9SPIO|nr:PASTA domain-containing protein [Entomospira nematocera]NIZ47529.1 PASTA domain-containing protein [Entomospira nematocera]WDI33931.1 PASTA domain-containing protein [Entomospira nematocera]